MSAQNIAALWAKIRDPKSPSLVNTLGIEITHMDEECIRGTMPVDQRTIQPFGLLHGGASVAFAETLASFGAGIHVDHSSESVVGLEINANHIRGVPAGGSVTGEARPLHLGRRTQIWQIDIKTPEGKLVCSSRCTLAVVARDKK